MVSSVGKYMNIYDPRYLSISGFKLSFPRPFKGDGQYNGVCDGDKIPTAGFESHLVLYSLSLVVVTVTRQTETSCGKISLTETKPRRACRAVQLQFQIAPTSPSSLMLLHNPVHFNWPDFCPLLHSRIFHHPASALGLREALLWV